VIGIFTLCIFIILDINNDRVPRGSVYLLSSRY